MDAQLPASWFEDSTVNERRVTVHIVPLGQIRLVLATTDRGGVLGCGAIDAGALDRFGIPAARVRAGAGGSIASLDDLLAGTVSEANEAASARGVTLAMPGREALALL
ncbi:MAG: YunC family protein [Dactylosporangium sp.]|nr:YunC family protein [Dactylosporangium sp.]